MVVPQNRWFIMENSNLKWMITGGSPILNFRKPPCVYSIYNHTINATPETPPVSGAKLDDDVQPETAIHHGGCPQARLSVIYSWMGFGFANKNN